MQAILETVASGRGVVDPQGVAGQFMYEAEVCGAGLVESLGVPWRFSFTRRQARFGMFSISARQRVGMTAEEHLFGLMGRFRAGLVEVGDFCREFERVHNFELNDGDVTPRVRDALARVFWVVVYYSPFADERARIPNYRGPEDVHAAVEQCLRDVGEG